MECVEVTTWGLFSRWLTKRSMSYKHKVSRSRCKQIITFSFQYCSLIFKVQPQIPYFLKRNQRRLKRLTIGSKTRIRTLRAKTSLKVTMAFLQWTMRKVKIHLLEKSPNHLTITCIKQGKKNLFIRKIILQNEILNRSQSHPNTLEEDTKLTNLKRVAKTNGSVKQEASTSSGTKVLALIYLVTIANLIPLRI